MEKTVISGYECLFDDGVLDYLSCNGYRLAINKAREEYVRLYVYLKKECWLLHRFILGAPKHLEVDHINRNPLDNRIENLRLCTRTENARNTGKSHGKTLFKGVSAPSKMHGFYCVEMGGKKSKRYGIIYSQKMAAIEYNKIAESLYGEFAFKNDVSGCELCIPRRAIELKRSRSGFRGVSFEKRVKKWRVTTKENGKQVHVGTFKNPIEAARAYDREAFRILGMYAFLNFPEDYSVIIG